MQLTFEIVESVNDIDAAPLMEKVGKKKERKRAAVTKTNQNVKTTLMSFIDENKKALIHFHVEVYKCFFILLEHGFEGYTRNFNGYTFVINIKRYNRVWT